jgi:Rod binding domain-containing protein
MASGISLPVTPSPVETPGRAFDPAKIKQTAVQFEALLLAQLLKSVREAGQSGATGEDQDTAGVSLMEMAEAHFAELIASKGGLGLSHLLINHLSPNS